MIVKMFDEGLGRDEIEVPHIEQALIGGRPRARANQAVPAGEDVEDRVRKDVIVEIVDDVSKANLHFEI